MGGLVNQQWQPDSGDSPYQRQVFDLVRKLADCATVFPKHRAIRVSSLADPCDTRVLRVGTSRVERAVTDRAQGCRLPRVPTGRAADAQQPTGSRGRRSRGAAEAPPLRFGGPQQARLVCCRG